MDNQGYQGAANNYENAVFVSYAWGGESERIVDELEKAFNNRGIHIVRDKRDLKYRGSIDEFEKRIGKGQCVVLVISDKYLRSHHCMYELLLVHKNQNLYERIFPIVLADAHVYDPVELLDYIDEWDKKIERLDLAIKQKSRQLHHLAQIMSELNKYVEIRAVFDCITACLSDMNALSPQIHESKGFTTLIDAVEQAGCCGKVDDLKNKALYTDSVKGTEPTYIENSDNKDLRKYLKWIFDTLIRVPLSKIISDANDKQLYLSTIYTPLITESTLSALQQLNEHPRLVLTGDSGSGKSTFVDFMMVCLAGEILGKEDNKVCYRFKNKEKDHFVNLEFLEDNSGPYWKHGPHIPIRVKLRNFDNFLKTMRKRLKNIALWDILREFILFDLRIVLNGKLKDESLEKLLNTINGKLLQEQNGDIMLFLDGWDEIDRKKRPLVKQAIERYAIDHPACRILVTSRPYAYQVVEEGKSLNTFVETKLAPFERSQIEKYIDNIYPQILDDTVISRNIKNLDIDQRIKNLKLAILSKAELKSLAARPLLLTLIVSLHALRDKPLPEKREEVYDESITLMLEAWNKPKRRNDNEQIPGLSELLHVGSKQIHGLLNELAFHAHAEQDGKERKKTTAHICETDLINRLLALCPRDFKRPSISDLDEILRGRAGIIIPSKDGFTCSHRAFQEYLAACYLTAHDYPNLVASLAQKDFERWHEVALLTVARAKRRNPETVWPFIDALCYLDPAPTASKELQWGALLAGLALVEDESTQYGRNQGKEESAKYKRERLQKWLAYILKKGDLPAFDRIWAGNTLAALGDIRFDSNHWLLPCIDDDANPLFGFCHINAGEFAMGEAQERHLVTLSEYWLAMYPVTVAQFRLFATATGRDVSFFSTIDNQPVVNITWQDAILYCDWLEGELKKYAREQKAQASNTFWQGLNSSQLVVTLPSEAEWEKAATGVNGWDYPWGQSFDLNRANFSKNVDDVNSRDDDNNTNPVGAYPGGVSTYGLLEMSGNVREWTRSLWSREKKSTTGPDFTYPYVSEYKREDIFEEKDIDDKRMSVRVLRGGSYQLPPEKGTCHLRDASSSINKAIDIGFRVAISPGPIKENEKWRSEREKAVEILKKTI